ncbi:MAG: hypothetical protein RL154_503 [Pseudomonadota bacterium]|jgi:hypothetical protein
MTNPFKINTTSYSDWEVLKDLEWHCTKCELKSGQAKTWQVWRQSGIQIAKDEKDNFYKIQFCKTCDMNTVHRKLESLEILEDTKVRTSISQYLARRIKEIYKNEEALFLREFPPKELEIDHKFPQIRWESDEEENKPTMSKEEIKSKFILLSRSNNLLKSRQCERCVRDGIRGSFPGIEFWHAGNSTWHGASKSDEKGCVGCFWYDPYEWRKKLNELVNSKNN